MSNIIGRNAVNITINNDETLDMQSIRKMAFIYNAIDDGWAVVRQTDSYIFTKKHEGKKEVYSDDYLKTFIERNMNLIATK